MPYYVEQKPSAIGQVLGLAKGVFDYTQAAREQKLQDSRADAELAIRKQQVGIEQGQYDIQKQTANNENALQPFKLQHAKQEVDAATRAAMPIGPLPKQFASGPKSGSASDRVDYYSGLLNYLGTRPGDEAAAAAKVAENQLNQATKAMDDENSGAVRVAVANASAAAAMERQMLRLTAQGQRPNNAEIAMGLLPYRDQVTSAAARASDSNLDTYMKSSFAPLYAAKGDKPWWQPTGTAGPKYSNMEGLETMTNGAIEHAKSVVGRGDVNPQSQAALRNSLATQLKAKGFDDAQVAKAVGVLKYTQDALTGQFVTTQNYMGAYRGAYGIGGNP